ncbi:putative nuclease HARBI1 [Temnothorax longispinosus]|uniref:putative nuclease HARBI1 n=1 Tax=Temnothorax longispinosus TaxID=300112 RepID=UPI003A9A40F3
MYALYSILKKSEKKTINKGKRKYWVSPIFTIERRLAQGASNNLVNELEQQDREKFVNYFRMKPALFEKLLQLIRPSITKQSVVREAIPPETRLHITIRYLATGDSTRSLSYAFRIGHNTVSKIVSETCEVIWNNLKNTVFIKNNESSWQNVADDFERLWNYPNCIGAIDEKHVTFQAPPNSGSTYYNYKGNHSINLLAISDAKYRFIIVDIGGEGRQSDGGIFRNSLIRNYFENALLKLPNPKSVQIDGPVLPYVLLADEAFPLTNFMMRPYPRSGRLNLPQKVFNYRLSQARRVVENAFGILAQRWRIYRKPIISSVANVKKIVQATIVLHNFIINNGEQMQLQDRYMHIRVMTRIIQRFPEGFAHYQFIEEGHLKVESKFETHILHSLMEMVHYLINGKEL